MSLSSELPTGEQSFQLQNVFSIFIRSLIQFNGSLIIKRCNIIYLCSLLRSIYFLLNAKDCIVTEINDSNLLKFVCKNLQGHNVYLHLLNAHVITYV